MGLAPGRDQLGVGRELGRAGHADAEVGLGRGQGPVPGLTAEAGMSRALFVLLAIVTTPVASEAQVPSAQTTSPQNAPGGAKRPDSDGRMVLASEPRQTDAGVDVQRITWSKNADATVRQLWESSTDGGRTWTIA